MSYHDEYARRRHFESSYREGYHVESGFEWRNPKTRKIDCMSEDSPYYPTIVAMREAVYFQLAWSSKLHDIAVFDYRTKYYAGGLPWEKHKVGAKYVGRAWVGTYRDDVYWENAEGKRYRLNPDGTIKSAPRYSPKRY